MYTWWFDNFLIVKPKFLMTKKFMNSNFVQTARMKKIEACIIIKTGNTKQSNWDDNSSDYCVDLNETLQGSIEKV